ncbi:MAG: polymerase beta subunit, central domain, partial [Patescibacteria group bacterium]|nr:polymerase beta subunit, central domain [Patescibacteria group bacterium]
HAAATDSYRLAEKSFSKIAQELSLLVPADAILELLRVIPETEDTVTINADAHKFYLKPEI